MLKNFVYLAAFSTFVVAVVIGFNIYFNYQTSTLPRKTQTRIEKITPKFDTQTINGLKSRLHPAVSLDEKSNVSSEDSAPSRNNNESDTASESAAVIEIDKQSEEEIEPN